MSLYVGDDSNNNPVFHMTKYEHSEEELKSGLLNDTVFHSDLPYMRATFDSVINNKLHKVYVDTSSTGDVLYHMYPTFEVTQDFINHVIAEGAVLLHDIIVNSSMYLGDSRAGNGNMLWVDKLPYTGPFNEYGTPTNYKTAPTSSYRYLLILDTIFISGASYLYMSTYKGFFKRVDTEPPSSFSTGLLGLDIYGNFVPFNTFANDEIIVGNGKFQIGSIDFTEEGFLSIASPNSVDYSAKIGGFKTDSVDFGGTVEVACQFAAPYRSMVYLNSVSIGSEINIIANSSKDFKIAIGGRDIINSYSQNYPLRYIKTEEHHYAAGYTGGKHFPCLNNTSDTKVYMYLILATGLRVGDVVFVSARNGHVGSSSGRFISYVEKKMEGCGSLLSSKQGEFITFPDDVVYFQDGTMWHEYLFKPVTQRHLEYYLNTKTIVLRSNF